MAEIRVKSGKVPGREFVGQKNLGANLQEATALWPNGEAVVFSMYEDATIVKLQGIARSAMEKGATDEEIQARLDSYVLGVVQRGERRAADPVEKIVALIRSGKMSVEEMAAKIRAKLAEGREGQPA